MKVSLCWLRELAPGMTLSAEQVEERLALRGAPVEQVEKLAQGLEGIVIGQVLEAKPHPNADRLTLCRVLGREGEVSVVCGAPTITVGGYYPFAPVGAVLPGDFKIKKRKIRGEVSQGMLCSERELGLGPDHAGIMLLEGEHEVGTGLAEALGLDDLRLDVEVTPNRGDLLSHLGIARELHCQGQAGLQLPHLPGMAEGPAPNFVRDEAEVCAAGVKVSVQEAALCPRYLGAVIRGVSVGTSPEWLANRLRAAGARSINNVVDATNYVMLEMGQPLHAFDLARLAGPEVIVACARPGEKLVTLDGEEHELSPEMLMIRDGESPVAVAGVMGGMDSEVSEGTTDLLLECALFESRQVRGTRRALGMSTDASYRFERGVDPEAIEQALLRAVSLIVATAGGALDGEVIDICPKPWQRPTVELRRSRVGKVLGVEFTPEEICALLEPLGYKVEEAESDEDGNDGGDANDAGSATGGEATMWVQVPGYRSYDTLREVDLIEEVARTYGFDNFPTEVLPYRPGTVPDHPYFALEDRLRKLLVSDGLSEAQTPALGPEKDGDVALLNPMSANESHLRRDRLSGLLTHVERNLTRGVNNVRLFEMGTVFAPATDPAERPLTVAPIESAHLAVVLTGSRAPVHWSFSASSFDLFDVARLLEIIAEVAFPDGEVAPHEGPQQPFLTGRSYRLVDRSGEMVGWGGEVDPACVDLPPSAGAVMGLEVVLPEKPESHLAVTARELPSQPFSERDVALLLPSSSAAGEVLRVMKKAGGALLEEAAIFDLYEGDDLPQGMRSVAYRLRFRAKDRTLTDVEVDRALARIIKKTKEATGVEPRS